MIKPGMYISDRYEIIDKVGSGGMADVYKALCHRLNRYVAIKILKSEFSSDTNFVQKFRAEAQSVAGLSHPNIVSVYDVGDDDGLHYIVMELVEGITLKRFIEKRRRLDVKEAVGIAIQIAMGMEAAHTHHIIHRDIKPQNIIISREGKVKVADFGIAKAATSNTISQNAIGSVHYLSPEQARGGYSDERSDIYSLGVTLYEMLTGQVPFAGDNSVSVALLHIQSEAVPVRELNPDVPLSVDKIIQKCMQKKPERRYQSASELINDLKRSIINPDGDYVSIASNASVSGSPTRNITEEELNTIKSAAKSPVTHVSNSSRKVKKKVKKETEELDSMDSWLEKILTVVSVLFAVALIVVIIVLLYKFFLSDDSTDNLKDSISNLITTDQPADGRPTSGGSNIKVPVSTTPTPSPTPASDVLVKMPKVIDLSIEDAESTLKAVSKDFRIVWTEEEYSDDTKKGLVADQYPAPDATVTANQQITLTVSAGSEMVELTTINDKDAISSIALLEALKFSVVRLEEYNDNIELGKVIRTEPEGGSLVPKETTVIVYVSMGPEIKGVECPLVVGKKESKAIKSLENANLVVGEITPVYSDEYDKGLVCAQSYEAGTLLDEGTVVSISVSLGKEKKAEENTVPDNGDEEDNNTPDTGNDNTDTGNTGDDTPVVPDTPDEPDNGGDTGNTGDDTPAVPDTPVEPDNGGDTGNTEDTTPETPVEPDNGGDAVPVG
ncbi:MAG: Stk1 family PASTA domain-containing Ser/Thr kinase [Lachnospiraceae bacterium]|nr:Stk1 family PASTA domain-containing Ser/Thr kinase [Lachnospiraceae bacterium]